MASSEYDYCFLEELSDNLKCCICQEVAKGMPKQHGGVGCGKLFCEECIQKNGDKPCPMCRGKNPIYFEDIRSESERIGYNEQRQIAVCVVFIWVCVCVGLRDIKELRVCCNNSSSCPWKGTVATLQEHAKKCDYTLVSCPNCRSEGKLISLARKDMRGHLAVCPYRLCKCEDCGMELPYVALVQVHGNSCLMKTIPCPNKGCGHVAERQTMEEHVREDCQYTVVLCRHSSIGCTKKGLRKHIGKHEEDSGVHLALSLQKIVLMDHELTSLKEEVSELKRCMRNFSSDSHRLNEATGLLKEETVTVSHELGALRGEVSEMKKDVEGLQSDSAMLRMDVDRLNKKVTTLVRVTGYMLLKRQSEPFLSDSFYTVPSGYAMVLAVYPNGYYVDGSHLSVYVRMVDVTYASRLQWPFKGNVKVELLNQLANRGKTVDKKHVKFIDSRSVASNGGWLCEDFVLHSELNFNPMRKTQYLMEDVLMFRVTVQEEF